MKRKQVLLACLNKLRASKNLPRTNVLNQKARNHFLGMIEDADSYAEYGYGCRSFLEQNPSARYLIKEYGQTGTELSKLLFSIGYAQCAEDSDYESTKWEMLYDWCEKFIDIHEYLIETPTTKLIDSIPTGEVVPKKILAVLKRAGIIDDYSCWGYLEGDYDTSRIYEYKGRYFQAKYLDGCFNPYLIKANILIRRRIDYLQYRGNFKREYPKSDMLVANTWNLHYKVKKARTATRPYFFPYFNKREEAIPKIKTRTPYKFDRHICLYGTII